MAMQTQFQEYLYYREKFNKVVLVSGDGDYKQLVDFLIEENKLEKILFPDRKRASSSYDKLGAPRFAALDDQSLIDVQNNPPKPVSV